jgi:hypothetical protein
MTLIREINPFNISIVNLVEKCRLRWWVKKVKLSLCLTNKHYAMKAYGAVDIQVRRKSLNRCTFCRGLYFR